MKYELMKTEDFGWNIHKKPINDSYTFFGWMELETKQEVVYCVKITKNISLFNSHVYKLSINLNNKTTGMNLYFSNYSFKNKILDVNEAVLKFGKELKILKFPEYINIDFKTDDFAFNIDLSYDNFIWLYEGQKVKSELQNPKSLQNLFSGANNLTTNGIIRINGFDFSANGQSFIVKGFGDFKEEKIKTHYQKIDLVLEDKWIQTHQFISDYHINATEIRKNISDSKLVNAEIAPLNFFDFENKKYATHILVTIDEKEKYYLEVFTQVLSNKYQFANVKNKDGKIIGKAFIETLPTFYNTKIFLNLS